MPDIIKGHDARDPTSIQLRTPQDLQKPVESESKLTIGLPVEYNVTELHPTVRAAWKTTIERLHRAGHLVLSVNLPTTKQALAAYYAIASAEAHSNLARFDGVRYGNPSTQSRPEGSTLYSQTRGEMFGDETKRRILTGAHVLSTKGEETLLIKAQKVRRLVRNGFDAVFRKPNPLVDHDSSRDTHDNTKVDVLITPTTLNLPPKLKDLEDQSDQSPTAAYGSDVLTVPASLAGLPAVSVPVPHGDQNVTENDVPTVGIQIIGQYGDEDMVLAAAREIEAMAA